MKVKRWVITHVSDKDGLRTLTFACQGRYTFATYAEAQEAMVDWIQPSGLMRVLTAREVASLEVREIDCWAGHFDPCGIYFD